jgi:hypothetical protein
MLDCSRRIADQARTHRLDRWDVSHDIYFKLESDRPALQNFDKRTQEKPTTSLCVYLNTHSLHALFSTISTRFLGQKLEFQSNPAKFPNTLGLLHQGEAFPYPPNRPSHISVNSIILWCSMEPKTLKKTNFTFLKPFWAVYDTSSCMARGPFVQITHDKYHIWLSICDRQPKKNLSIKSRES